MTGISVPWRMNKEQLTSFLRYCKKPVSAALIGGGSCLMLEHLFEFDGFDLLDFWGHEYLGLGLIIAGFFLSMKWHQWDTLNLSKFKNWWR
jgi:hypothetical protein